MPPLSTRGAPFPGDGDDAASERTGMTARSTLHGVITGSGERDPGAAPPAPRPAAPSTRPFIVLDLRDADDYAACHILHGARCCLWRAASG